jgi:hypothetical protein
MDKTEAAVDRIPNCDLCKSSHGLNRPAVYDAQTKMGLWAYLCEAHFRLVGIGLGTGKGQRLVLRDGVRE